MKRLLAVVLGLLAATGAHATTFTFQTPISGDEVPVTLTLVDTPEGNAVEVAVSIPTGSGDLLGLFGNLAADAATDDRSLAPLLQVTDLSGDLSDAAFDADRVTQVGPGNNVRPAQGWDFGLRFGQAGKRNGAKGGGAVESARVLLSAPGLSVERLTEADNGGWIFGVRIQSTSGPEGSAKVGLSADIPEVAFEVPFEGAFINEDPALVEGTVSGPGAAVTVNGVAAAIAEGGFSASVPLEEGENVLTAVASNDAGSVSEDRIVVLDTVPPELALVEPADGALTVAEAVTFSGTVTDANPVETVGVGLEQTEPTDGAFELSVTLDLGENDLEVFAVDAANNLATTTLTVTRGTLPEIAFDSPAPGAVVRVEQVEVRGRVDEGTTTVAVAGQPAILEELSFSALVPLVEGSNEIPVEATNRFGTSRASLTVENRQPPVVRITSPTVMDRFAASPVTVTGTVDDPAAVVEVRGVAAAVSGGSGDAPATFSASVPLREGVNLVTARATDATGEVGSTTVSVVLDTTPPLVTVDSPADGSTVSDAAVNVSGLVNDITTGSEEGAGPQVQVAGVAARVDNGRFLAESVPLQPGANQLAVTATDGAGNSTATVVTVERRDLTDRTRLRKVSGDNQTGPVATLLPEPLVVEMLDADGLPVANRTVIFRVAGDTGLLTAGDRSGRSVAVSTDSQGRASAFWSLGTHAGAGSQKVEVSSVRVAGAPVFTASTTAGAPAKIFTEMGETQVGVVGEPLPRPLMATVTDAGNNRLAGVPVTFTAVEGGGSFAGEPQTTVLTDVNGMAVAQLTLGPADGIENNLVQATFEGNPGAPVKFVASGVLPGDPAETRLSGVVLDHVGAPLEGVTVRLENGDASTATGPQGRFELAPVPVGDLKVVVDGSTAERPGAWPTLTYDVVTVAGRDNGLGGNVRLLPLDLPNGVLVDETTGGTLTLPGMPGFALDVAPGSATFPDGSKSGLVSVTRVNSDNIPMPPNFGQQPRLVVTIQPTGVHFDPPARLTLPNVDGLPPGAVTEMYSFDHDLGTFVSIGPGTVSDDGLVVASNPGVGVIEGGWHCGGDPAAQGSCCDCKDCQKCDESQGTCLPDDGASCDDELFCTSATGTEPGPDKCENGSCIGKMIEDADRGDITPQEYDIRPIVNAIRGVSDALSFGPCEVARPSIAGGFKITFFERCCESSDSIEIGGRVAGTLTAKIATIECPIPGLSAPLGNIAVLGVVAGVGFSGQFEGSGGQDPCGEGQCTQQISGSLGATLSGKLKAELKLDPDLLSVSGGVQGSGQIQFTQKCDGPVEFQGCVGPPSFTGEFSLLGGINKSFNFVPHAGWVLCVP